MATLRAILLPVLAVAVAMTPARVSATVSSLPSPSNLPSPSSAQVEAIGSRIDWTAVPTELQLLKFDASVMRSGDKLLKACDELVDLAYELRNLRPSRPGPHAVLGLCDADSDATTAQAELQEARVLLEKMRGPPGLWPGETYYATEGPSDLLISLYRREGEVIAETFEIGEGGATVYDRVWWRDTSGKVERMRFDISANASILGRYIGARATGEQADVVEAIAGYDYLSASSRQHDPSAAVQVGVARFAANAGWLDRTRIEALFQVAVARADEFALFAYAQWLLSTQRNAIDPIVVRDLLRRSAKGGLPEAQILLGILCEARADAHCEADEAKLMKAAAEVAYGRGEVEWERFVDWSGNLQIADAGQAGRALAEAAKAGSGAAMDVLAARELAAAEKDGHSRDAETWQQRAVDIAHPRAIYLQARARLELATGTQAREAAVAQLQRAVDLGVSDATVVLGNVYRDGKGVEKDASRATRLFRVGAEWGNAVAQNNYAFVLERGEGIDADPVSARRWYMRSLVQGYANAGAGIGNLYRKGRGVEKDDKLAALYYRWGSDLGCISCQDVLGDMLWNGEGVAQNRVEAVRWYEKAADQGNLDSQRSAARAYQFGDGVEQSWPRAIAGYRRCAEAGAAACQADLGWVLQHAPKELSDLPEALVWFRKAADQGNVSALNSLGWAHEWGDGVDKDVAQAFEFYHRCEAHEETDAAECLNNLGRAYMFGSGTAVDASKAVSLYRRAKDLGSVSAICNLGEALANGAGVEADQKQALALLQSAAEKNNPRCQWLYGSHLMQGPREGHAAALEMLRKASENGEHAADANVARLLLYNDSSVRDEARGIELATHCFEAGNPLCGTVLGIYYRWWKQPHDVAVGNEWLAKAEKAGDADAAYNLGREAYLGLDGKANPAAARPHLEIAAKSNDIAALWLAHLDQADGRIAEARAQLLARRSEHLLIRLFLVTLCAPPNICEGIPTRDAYLAELDKVRNNKDLLNNLVWSAVTDPFATREDGELAVAITDRYAETFAHEWPNMDTRAAALARAGRSAEACALQRRVIAAAAKAKSGDSASLAERRDAYCRGETWQGE